MLENVIGRSPKAWGLGQNAQICFPPARGAYFSTKYGQTSGMGYFYKGVGLPGARGSVSDFRQFFRRQLFAIFFRNWVDFGRLWEAKMGSKIDFLKICFRGFFRMRFGIDFGWIFGGSKPEK